MKRTQLQRHTPLHSKPETTRAFIERNRRELPKISARQKIRNREYSKAATLLRKESPYCARCVAKGIETMGGQTHHIQGRDGQRMSDKTLLVRLCWQCHHKIHNDEALAVSEGWKISRHIGAHT